MYKAGRNGISRGLQTGGLLLLLIFSELLYAKPYLRWNLLDTRVENAENLVYHLSYKGFFTAFFWKGLANVAFIADTSSHLFNNQPSCYLMLKVSTENFGFAETLHPVRFIWRTTIDPAFPRVLLTEEINEIVDGKYELVWLDYANNKIELFRKRRKIPDQIIYAEDEEGESDLEGDIVVSSYWEKDGKKAVPAFLDTFPPLENGMSYLVYDKTAPVKLEHPVLDPLSLLYAARWWDYDLLGDLVVDVNYKDRINQYTAHRHGREIIKVAGRELPATKIELTRTNKDEAKNEGYMLMWLSDDGQKLPLQYQVDAKFGKIKVHISEKSLINYRKQKLCINPGADNRRVTSDE